VADDQEKKGRLLIERKEALAVKRSAKGIGVSSGTTPMGNGPPNRHGLPKLPVDQSAVKKWPVLDLGDVPKIDLATWQLEVDGLVEAPRVYNWEQFMALPQTEDVSDFHCVTGWSRFDNRWKGVRFFDIAERARPFDEARFVFFTAYDVAPGTSIPYTTNLPLDEALQDDVLLVHTWEGAPLERDHGGPVRMITPSHYAWKGAKWIKRITFGAEDQLGFWEERGYSNTANPWLNDRYSR